MSPTIDFPALYLKISGEGLGGEVMFLDVDNFNARNKTFEKNNLQGLKRNYFKQRLYEILNSFSIVIKK